MGLVLASFPGRARDSRTMSEGSTSQSALIFDRKLIRARRRRAAALGAETFLLDRVADDLAERLAAVLRRFDLALDLGTPGEAVRAALARLGSVGTIIAADEGGEKQSVGFQRTTNLNEHARQVIDELQGQC